MKKIYFSILFVFASFVLFSQSQKAFKYQAIARDEVGNIIENEDINLRISILQNSKYGPIIYQEEHQIVTNQYGLINLKIGNGTTVNNQPSTVNFSEIDWSTGNHYIQVELKKSGANDYTIMGTSELLAVPYAMYAFESGNSGTRAGEWTNDGTDLFTDETSFPGAKVGVGTTMPGGKMHIYGPGLTGPNRPMLFVQHESGFSSTFRRNTNSPANALFLLQKSRGDMVTPSIVQDGDNIGQIRMEGFDGTDYKTAGWIRVAVDGTPSAGIVPGAVLFATTNSSGVVAERMRIDNDGNLGIGTTMPSYKLEVEGDVNASNYYLNGSLFEGSKWSGGSNIYFSTGNVGIGHSSPSYIMDIKSTFGPRLRVFSEDDYFAGLLAKNNTHEYFIGVQGTWESAGGVNSGFHIYDNTVGARRMVIDHTGNMGIGSNAPSARLDVAGGTRVAQNNDQYGLEVASYSVSNTQPAVQFWTAGQGPTLNVDWAGTVGDKIATFKWWGNLLSFIGTDGGAYFNGNVGIGTSTPSTKLEVAGKTKTSSLQVTAGAAANKVLVSDASGNASWDEVPSQTHTIHFPICNFSSRMLVNNVTFEKYGWDNHYINFPEIGTYQDFSFQFPMPADFSGTTITLRILYSSDNTTGNFAASLGIKTVELGGELGNAPGGVTSTLIAPSTAHHLAEFTKTLAVTSSTEYYHITIRRLPTDPIDSNTGNLKIFGIAIDYQN